MRPRVEVLRDYLDFHNEMLRLNPSHRESIQRHDAPERMRRWAVELECGCTTEALTHGKEHPPTEGPWIRALGGSDTDDAPGNSSSRTFVVHARSHVRGMTPGFLWCAHDEHHPFREITRWDKREERWSSRTGKRYAVWKVLLSCGHFVSVVTDFDWRPEHGHRPQPEKAEKYREWLAKPGGSDIGRLAMEAELLDGCPEPQKRESCADCVCRRRIVSFEPIGPLTWPGDEKCPSRELLTRQLTAAEKETDKLRARLEEAEARVSELRAERDKLPDLG